jgi:hypothetical protein
MESKEASYRTVGSRSAPGRDVQEIAMKDAIAAESLKATPPVTVTAVTWMSGLTLNDYVLLATLAYIALQAAYLIYRWVLEVRRGK